MVAVRAVGASIVLSLLACAQPADAQSTIPGPTYYVGDSWKQDIPVTASVGGRCQFLEAPSGSYDAGALDNTGNAWSNQFAFKLDCNGASRVAVVSANGGLKNAAGTNDAGYTALAPYDVKLNLVGAGGASASGQCTAAALKNGSAETCAFRGTASQTVGLQMASASQNLTGSYLEVKAPATPSSSVLINGSYSDTLTVTVAASI